MVENITTEQTGGSVLSSAERPRSRTGKGSLERNKIVQEILLPEQNYPTELYYRARWAESQGEAVVKRKPQSIVLEKGITVSFNTYFNSFYESYWSKFTMLNFVAVDLLFSGAVKVDVYHHTAQQRRKLIESQTIDSSASLRQVRVNFAELRRSSPFPQRTGRYFVEITALAETEIFELGYSTPDLPQREVSLSIGICTFDREQYISATLKQVLAEAQRTNAIKHVFVVNQGKEFEGEEVKTVLQDPLFELISQPNLGGCGGFTRTILEAQDLDPGVTHHLLMDDDIVLDGRVIGRSINFLNYCHDEVVLGGSMLDSLRPNILYEGGAFLRPNNTIEPYAHNVDMASPYGPNKFQRVVETDYNAWWYCIVPVEWTREVKLPPPIFIRGDDFEYGQRLVEAGVPTVSLPGVAVWHEPFYAKPPSWQSYYDLRNRLIFGATYQKKVRSIPNLHVLDLMLDRVYTHDYGGAALLQQALTDYLAGPDELFATSPSDKHKQISQLKAAHPTEVIAKSAAQHLPRGRVRRRVGGTHQLIVEYVWRAIVLLYWPRGNSEPVVFRDIDAHSNSVRNKPYVITNGEGTYHHKRMPNRMSFIKGLARSLMLAARYGLKNAQVRDDWNNHIQIYRERPIWERLFGIEPSK